MRRTNPFWPKRLRYSDSVYSPAIAELLTRPSALRLLLVLGHVDAYRQCLARAAVAAAA